MRPFLAFIFLFAYLYPIVAQQERSIALTSEYIITSGNTSKVKLVIVVPRNVRHKQVIKNVSYSRKPTRIYRKNNNKYAEFILERPHKEEKIAMTVYATIFQCDLTTMLEHDEEDNSSQLLSPYLINEKNIESNDESILNQAYNLRDEDLITTLENIYYFVNKEIKYGGYTAEPLGAKQTLHVKKGDCTEFSDLFIALCRANGLPARYVSGFLTDWKNTPCHNWTEVYINQVGWVPFDPTAGNYADFWNMKNRYLYVSTVRNDRELSGYDFFSYNYWGERIKVKNNVYIQEY